MIGDAASALRDHPAFASFDEAARARLFAAGVTERRMDGETLICEGEASDSVLLLTSGTIDVEVATSNGPVPLATLDAPALLGEVGVFARLPRSATIRANGVIEALSIPAETVLEESRLHPDLLQHVVLELGERLGRFNQAIGYYTNALSALEDEQETGAILDELLNPPPELVNFAVTFRGFAEQIRQRRLHQRDMANAAAIQRSMLPESDFSDPGGRFACHAEFRPAREIGGDFYDVFPIDDRRVALTIGDVSGKGTPAALFMAVCQSVLRLTLRETGDLGRAVSRASDLLETNNSQSMFATAFIAVLDLETGRLTYCNAGHNPPVLLRGDGRTERLLSAAGDPPLAVWSPAEFTDAEIHLAAGDRLVLFTDGVTESPNGADEEFGEERLVQLLQRHRDMESTELSRLVLAAVDAFVAKGPQFDDLTCIISALNGAVARKTDKRSPLR